MPSKIITIPPPKAPMVGSDKPASGSAPIGVGVGVDPGQTQLAISEQLMFRHSPSVVQVSPAIQSLLTLHD